MPAIKESLHRFEIRFDQRAERFSFRHPHLAFLAMFIGLLIFTLIAVTASTTLITLPFALLFGWL